VFGRLALLAAGVWAGTRFIERGDPDDPEPASPPRPFGGLDEVLVALPDATDAGDARPAIDELIDELRHQGRGGEVHLPPGEWVVDRAVIVDVTGMRLTGAGMRATRLRLAPGVRGHVVEVVADGVTVERLTIVGNGADVIEEGGLGHGIRVGDNAAHVQVRDVVIEDVQGYGIGFQPQPAAIGEANVGGVFDHAVLRNVTIIGTGLDGVDFKNYDGDNPSCPTESYEDAPDTPRDCNGGRSFLRHLSVTGMGRSPRVSGRAGIDIRGRRHLQGIEALDVDAESNGVELRTDAGGRPNGLGGFWSTIEGFYVATAGPIEGAIENGDIEGVEYHTGVIAGPGEIVVVD
jgi:hypothetical protein